MSLVIINMFSAIIIFYLVKEVFALVLPKNVERCRLSDPLLNSCMRKSVQNYLPQLLDGRPEIGIPVLEPFALPDIHNKDPILNFKFTRNKIYGTPSIKIEEFKINQTKKKITFIYEASGYMDSHYSVNGRLLLFPIVGEGESHIIMNGIKYVYKLNYDVVKGDDGKTYWKIIKYKVTYTAPMYANFQFTNLFNGNKELADTLLRFTNENWREIFDLVGPGPMKAVSTSIIGHLTTIFLKVSVDELFDP